MPKVLIAHGLGANPEIAKNATTNLRKSLESLGFEVEYLSGPVNLTLDDYPFPPPHDPATNKVTTWWYVKPDQKPDLTPVKSLLSKYKDQNDIVGFIGFSQGASLTSLVASNYKEWIPSLKFAIAYSGFPYPSPFQGPIDLSAYGDKIRIPYLTIIGTKDPLVPNDLSLSIAKDLVVDGKADSFTHDGGHQFADDEEHVAKAIDWVKKQI